MLINPSSLYSGGNVKLDPTPYVNIALRQRAMKEARKQAVDQYFQKLPDTINDKGVRDAEVGIISDYKNKLAQTYLENREALRNGDPNAQLKMQKLYREAQGVVRESQNATQDHKDVSFLYRDKNNQPILTSENFIDQQAKADLPVTHPDYKRLDIADVMANRPFNQDDYVKQLKLNFKYGEGIPTITPHPTDSNLEVVTSNPILDDQTKQNLYNSSAYKLHNDVAFQRQLHKDFSTPEQIAPLNEISKQVFGHEIKEPEDVAAAYSASLLPSKSNRAKVIPSIDAKNAEWDRRNEKQFAQRKAMAHLNDSLIKGRKKDGTIDEAQVGYPTVELDKQYGEDLPIWDKDRVPQGVKRVVYADKLPITIMRTINPRDANKGIYDVEGIPIKQQDGTTRLGYYVLPDNSWQGKEGKIGAEDARNLFVKENVNTKFKLGVNTHKPEINNEFETWKSKLPKNLQNDSDYDLRGLYDSNPNQAPSSNLHFPDKFKKPNHITFSEESIYSKGMDAGKWGRENGKDVFYAADVNVKNAGGAEKLANYFKQKEPGVKLVLPKNGSKNVPASSKHSGKLDNL